MAKSSFFTSASLPHQNLMFQRRFLVITQNSVPFKYVSTDHDVHLKNIRLTDGFSEDQSLQLFANTIGKAINTLPRQALSVARVCHGHPFMISLFAALIKNNNNELAKLLECWRARQWNTVVVVFQSVNTYKKRSPFCRSSVLISEAAGSFT